MGDDHLARVVERQVNQFDRAPLDDAYRGRGSLPYDPMPMLKMVIYQYLSGNQSPATWAREAKLNLAMQWLGRGYTPAYRTWYEFRDRIGKFIETLHEQVVTRALNEGLLDPTEGVQDGTSVAACASRHRMVNRPTLEKRMEQLDAILEGEVPAEVPKWVPTTESGCEELRNRMQQASEVLEERIDKNAKRPTDKRKDPDKIKVSLSDPAAPLGLDKLKVFRPLYTIQHVVAPVSNIIMAYCCEPSVTDTGTLAGMIDKTQEVVGGRLRVMVGDAAYCSIVDLQDCQQRGIELFAPVQQNSFTKAQKEQKPNQQIPRDEFRFDSEENCYHCPKGHRLKYVDRTRKSRHSGRTLWEYRYRCDPAHCSTCTLAANCLRVGSASRTVKRLEGQELLDAQRAKMETPEAKERYRIRGQTVELGFGDAKGNRQLTRFHGRGPSRASTETGIMVLAQNLQRIDRLTRDRANPLKTVT